MKPPPEAQDGVYQVKVVRCEIEMPRKGGHWSDSGTLCMDTGGSVMSSYYPSGTLAVAADGRRWSLDQLDVGDVVRVYIEGGKIKKADLIRNVRE